MEKLYIILVLTWRVSLKIGSVVFFLILVFSFDFLLASGSK